MTPKEKAKELIDKFWYSLSITLEQAKQCALIAVDEIISSNPHSNPLNTNVESTMNYWQQVKQEIQAL
jgi:predicted proteasome-type protease